MLVGGEGEVVRMGIPDSVAKRTVASLAMDGGGADGDAIFEQWVAV